MSKRATSDSLDRLLAEMDRFEQDASETVSYKSGLDDPLADIFCEIFDREREQYEHDRSLHEQFVSDIRRGIDLDRTAHREVCRICQSLERKTRKAKGATVQSPFARRQKDSAWHGPKRVFHGSPPVDWRIGKADQYEYLLHTDRSTKDHQPEWYSEENCPCARHTGPDDPEWYRVYDSKGKLRRDGEVASLMRYLEAQIIWLTKQRRRNPDGTLNCPFCEYSLPEDILFGHMLRCCPEDDNEEMVHEPVKVKKVDIRQIALQKVAWEHQNYDEG